MAFSRANLVLGHCNGYSNSEIVCDYVNGDIREIEACPAASKVTKLFPDSDDDVVVVSALRTPLCKGKRGLFKDSYPSEWLSKLFVSTISDTAIDPLLIDDICIGNVLNSRASHDVKVAQVFSRIPNDVPAMTVNRQCASGLQACMNIAEGIKCGRIDIGLGGGFESMSRDQDAMGRLTFAPSHLLQDHPDVQHMFTPMGITSENVAERYNVSREKQDWLAYQSHLKAANAQKNGWYDDELISIRTQWKNKDGKEEIIVVKKDEGIRAGTTLEGLAKLKPAFKPSGSTTAGNASQVSDGAGAVLLARRSAARRHNLPVLGVVRSYAVKGVPAEVMGIGPAFAIPAALSKIGLTTEDIDIFEINEAFASQAVYCIEKLNIPYEKVNPKGGAIALGHPLGATGARQIGTLLHEMKRRQKRGFGVVSMCMGTGMGAACVLEYPGAAK